MNIFGWLKRKKTSKKVNSQSDKESNLKNK